MAKRAASDSLGHLAADKTAFALPTGPAVLGAPSAGDTLLGSWESEKGKCRMFKDPITARLTYEEPLEDGARVHGWLDTVAGEKSLWQGTLALLEAGKGPWYGPSFGEPPEVVGDIRVRLLSAEEPLAMETQIRMAGEDAEWQPAVKFHMKGGADTAAPTGTPSLANSMSASAGAAGGRSPADEEEEEKEQGDRKRSKR